MGKEGKAALKQRNMYPEWRFRVHIRETCTRKACFGYMSGKRVPEKPFSGTYRGKRPTDMASAAALWAGLRSGTMKVG